MSQELNLNELEAAARAYPANITRTVCALLDHIRALEAGKVPEGYRLVRAELRDEMIRMAAPRRCKIGSVCTDCTCAGSDSEANAPGMVADSAGGADKRDARDAERLDWLLWKLPGDAIRHCVGELSDTADRAEFRAAIDAMIWRTGSPDALRPTASPADQVEPDMLWGYDDPESGPSSTAEDFAENFASQGMMAGDESVVRVQCAKSMPDRKMLIRVSKDPEAKDWLHWEWIDAAMSASKEGESNG